MKILIDMNLSPLWKSVLEAENHEVHYASEIGPADATDVQLLYWAQTNGAVVLTQDHDFSAILADRGAKAPSIFVIREADVDPATLGSSVVSALALCEEAITAGAIVSFRSGSVRLRKLPLA